MNPTRCCYRHPMIIMFGPLFFLLILLGVAGANTADSTPVSNNDAVYIIQFEGAPLSTYKGTISGFSATNPKSAGTRKLEYEGAAAQKYIAYLRQQRQDKISHIEATIGHPITIIHHYDTAFNGIAVRLSDTEAATVATLSGIVRVEKDREIKSSANSTGGTSHPAPVAGRASNHTLFIPALLLTFTLLWAAWRRKVSSWRWIIASASLVILTTACGGGDSHNEIRLESPDGLACSPGAAWIGAQGVWDGSSTGGLPATMGEEIVVGIIDTGISPHSPSFAEIGDDGYQHHNPRGQYYGVCDPGNAELYNPNFPCNEKLIGAWNCVPDEYNAVDFNGHGSHVAATAAGNIVNEAIVHFDSGFNLSATISGVAPHANLISYKTMDETGVINSSAIIAAIDQAIKDGVDVINISLGGGVSDPWNDLCYGLLLNAREAGISVAIATGNDGPESGTVDDISLAPWLTAVGASSHDILYSNNLIFETEDGTMEEFIGLGLTPAYGPATVVYAGDYGDALCKGNFNAPFNGEIVICDRGEIARVDKGKNVKANGGGGMIHAEVNPGGREVLVADAHFLPATHITQTDADELKAWLADAGSHQATISGMAAYSDATVADMVTAFSSRGWNQAIPSIIKPDIVAPGASIIAPVIDGVGYEMMNGTSMASPHIAGAFALLKVLRPDWSPAQAQAAIMTTAITTVTVDDEGTPATPFDAGAGRIDIGHAAQAALILDENRAGYENGDPALYWQTETIGVGVATDLNLASFGDGSCMGECSWQRTLQNMSDSATAWRATVDSDSDLALAVSPTSFNLAAGESIELTVEAEATDIPLENWAFGRIILTEVDGYAPDATMPVAVRHMSAKIPTSLEIVTSEQAGTNQYFQLEATNISALTVTPIGLKAANVTQGELGSDPTPDDFANEDGGTFMLPIVIPDNALVLFIDLESSESPDLDLYVGKEGSVEPVASSGNSDASELIMVTSPEAGDWWIAVHNFASYRQADLFKLRYAVVTQNDTDAANLNASTEPLNSSPFSLTLDWNLPDAMAGEYWYGAVQLGTTPETIDDIGTIPLKLVIE